jgi:hypothetical protein
MLCALLCCGGRARAQDPRPFGLHWRGDAGCGAPQDLPGEVARLTRPELQGTEAFSFEVLVARQPSGMLLLDLRARGPGSVGNRQLELSSCREAQEAAILLIAMTLDPQAQTQLELPRRDEAPRPVEHQAAVEPRAKPASNALEGSLGAGLLFDPFSLQKPSAGPSISGALSFRAVQVRLAASYLIARSLDDLPAGAAGKVDLFDAALGIGPRFHRRYVAFGPVAELELGAVRGRVSGVPDARAHATLWAAALAGLWLELPARGRVAVQLSVQGGVPLRRPRFGLIGGPSQYTVPAALLRLHLGVVFRFGGTKELPGDGH